MADKLTGPTAGAKRIAEGLRRTGRAFAMTTERGFICLRSATGGFYWVAYDEARVLRGDDIKGAESLQSGFVSVMERAGT